MYARDRRQRAANSELQKHIAYDAALWHNPGHGKGFVMTGDIAEGASAPPPCEGLGAISFETAFVRPVAPTPDDFDMMGHVNNTAYLKWAQDMATAHWEAVAPEEMRAAFLWVVLRHEVDYRDPILPGEAAEARTWLGRASGPRYERYVDIRKPGAARASARVLTTWCMIDRETRRPRRVGADIFSAFGVDG